MGREMGGRFRREGIYVYLWLIHVEVWQKTAKVCKAIILQLKKKQHLPVFVVQSLSPVWLCNSMDCSMAGFPVLHYLQSLLRLMSIELVMPSNHLILCHPFLFLPSIFPSIRIFSSELAPHIRWPKYRSFSFSISPSNEYSGLISLGLTG